MQENIHLKNLNLKTLALPIYFDLILRFIGVFINTYMVSLVDVDLVGALGAGNEIFTLFITIFSFLGVGCSVVVAQALGARKNSLALRALHLSISFNALIGLISAIVVHYNASFILKLLSIPPKSFEASKEYLEMISLVFFINAISVVLAAIIRVYGRVKSIVVISLCVNIIMLFGNYIALFRPFGIEFYGLKGVGISTAIARIVGAIMLLFVLIKLIKIKIYPSLFFKFQLNLLKKILHVGTFSAGECLIWTIQYLIAFKFIASMGEVSLSIQTIYFQISSFIFFIGGAISMANEIIVGKLVGAKKMELAYNSGFKALKTGVILTIFMSLFIFLIKFQIMKFFNLPPNFQKDMLNLFFLTLILEPCRAFNIIMVNSLRAAGDAKFPFLMAAIFMLNLSLPLGYFLGIYLKIGILGVWLGFLADEFIRSMANTLRWKSKKWQSKALV